MCLRSYNTYILEPCMYVYYIVVRIFERHYRSKRIVVSISFCIFLFALYADLQYFLCYIVCLFVFFVCSFFFYPFFALSFYVFLCSSDSISGPRVLLSLILNK